MKQLLSVAHALHINGFMHRDIKMENLIFAKKKDFDLIKLIDFGSAIRINGKNSL